MRILLFVSSKCSHCPAAERVVKKIAPEYKNRGVILNKVRAQTPEGKSLSAKYNVMATPTILFVDENGKEMRRIVGAPEEQELRDKIERAIGLKKSFLGRLFG